MHESNFSDDYSWMEFSVTKRILQYVP